MHCYARTTLFEYMFGILGDGELIDVIVSSQRTQLSGFGVTNAAQARRIAAQPGTRIRALDGPTDTEGYRPSRALDRFVRCRDETLPRLLAARRKRRPRSQHPVRNRWAYECR